MNNIKYANLLRANIAFIILGVFGQALGRDVGQVYLPLVMRKPPLPASGLVVFSSDRDGDMEIYRMNYDGSDVTPLTFNNSNDGAPDWDPYSAKIAYSSNLSGQYEIYVLDTTIGSPHRLTEQGNCYSPQWSPDGSKIAFYSERVDGNLIFTMNPDGSNLTQITAPEISGYNPYWSPDGKTIAFLSSRNPAGLYTIDAAGETTPVLVWENADIIDMAWSPDGEQFAVIIGDPNEDSFDVYLYEIDSGATRRLTDTLFHNFGVDWYPLGNYLTFHSDMGGMNMEVYTMTTNGTLVTNITNHSAYDVSPDWKP